MKAYINSLRCTPNYALIVRLLTLFGIPITTSKDNAIYFFQMSQDSVNCHCVPDEKKIIITDFLAHTHTIYPASLLVNLYTGRIHFDSRYSKSLSDFWNDG